MSAGAPERRIRYALAFIVKAVGSPRNRRRGRGVELGRDGLVADGEPPRPLRAMVRVRLLPFAGGDEPDWGHCELVFDDGFRLVVTSLGEHGLPTPAGDRDYAAFLRELHARLDTADRARIVFEDGAGFGIAQALVLIAFTVPSALVALRAEQPWLRTLGLLLLATLVVGLVWAQLRHGEPKRYAPERLPARALPPPERPA